MSDLWNDMNIQFPRLIAEMNAAGVFDLLIREYEQLIGQDEKSTLDCLLGSMDLRLEDVMHIVDVADDTWEVIKTNLTAKDS